MISLSDLLKALHDASVSVTVQGGQLTLHPGSLVPPDLVPMIRKHKQEIITALRSRPSRAEVLQRLATMEPCTPAEAAYVHRLEANGWSRRELVSLLNEDAARVTLLLSDRTRENVPAVPVTEEVLPLLECPSAVH